MPSRQNLGNECVRNHVGRCRGGRGQWLVAVLMVAAGASCGGEDRSGVASGGTALEVHGGGGSLAGSGGQQEPAGGTRARNDESGGSASGSGGDFGGGGVSTAGGGGVATGGVEAGIAGGTLATVQDVPAGTVCASLSALQCEAEAVCCKAPGRGVDACKATMEKKCADLYLDQASTDPVSGYAPHRTGLALAEFQGRAAACDPTLVAWGASVSGLRGIFSGTKRQGVDCTPKSLLDTGDAAAHLLACEQPADVACLPGAVAWKCTPRAGVGGACFSDTNCQDGLYCDNPRTALVGATCKTRKSVGAACTAGGQCASLVCKRSVCVAADVEAVYCLTDG